MARQLDADVAYACVEIVPAELRAIHDGTAVVGSTVVDLSATSTGAEPGVRVFAANLAVLGNEQTPDEALPGEIERFIAEARDASGQRGVRVLVVDSRSEGYGLGLDAPRALADGLIKFAAERGLTVVLLEETVSPEPSQWCFAVDTVLELSGDDDIGPGARLLRVTKHRFAAATVGPHLLEIDHTGVALYPSPATYRSKRILPRSGEIGAPLSLVDERVKRLDMRFWMKVGLFVDVGSMFRVLGAPDHLPTISWAFGRSDLALLWAVYQRVSQMNGRGTVAVGDLGSLRKHPEPELMLAMLGALRDLVCGLGFDIAFIDTSDSAGSLAPLLTSPTLS